ncbi:MAG: hypothetical protein RR063_11325, partial [Anaerovoracaceae bacterium]
VLDFICQKLLENNFHFLPESTCRLQRCNKVLLEAKMMYGKVINYGRAMKYRKECTFQTVYPRFAWGNHCRYKMMEF